MPERSEKMPDVRERLVLEDKFSSTLNKFAGNMGATARMTAAAAATVQGENDRMAAGARNATDMMVESARHAAQGVSGATQDLVNRLGSTQAEMNAALTENQIERELKRLETQMQRAGLVWTSTGAEFMSSTLLRTESLRSLADQGMITANAMAQNAFASQQAAAEQRAASEATKAAEQEMVRVSREAGVAQREAARAASEAASTARAASKLEAQAAREAAQAEREKAESVARVKAVIAGGIGGLASWAGGLLKSATSANKSSQAHSALGKQLGRTMMYMFSLRKIFGFLSDTIERAPKGIQKSWNGAANGVKDTFARAFVSMLQTMQPAIDRFNAFLKSPAGQKFAHGLETVMAAAGQAVGWLLDKITALGAWIGDNFSTVMAVAGVLLAAFAGYMLLTAIATMAANAPLLLLIGLAAALVVGLQAAGVTSDQIFNGIGQGLGWLYALAYNLVADAWNLFAVFGEFFANFMDSPSKAVARLVIGVFDTILGVVETVAAAIDALTGKNWSGVISGFRSDMQKWADDTYGAQKITIDRMEKKDVQATMDVWGKGAEDISQKFTGDSLAKKLSPQLTNIDKNTKQTAQNTAKVSDEDLKLLEDVAVRRYETKVNTTTLTPSITVNVGAGADRSVGVDIGNTLKLMLAEQMASHTTASFGEVI